MANGYNPYNVVGTQQGLLEDLLQSEQHKKQAEMTGNVHKGEMGKQFQTEQIAAQKEQEKLLQKQRKPGFLEQITPLLGLIPGVGTIASATLGGLTGMYKAKQQSKFAKKQIGKAKGAGLDNKLGGTFLGGQFREDKAAKDTMLDQMLEETKVSGGDLLKTGLTEGIKGFTMGKMGEGLGEGIEEVKANKELLEGLEGIEGVDIDKIGGLEDLDNLTDDQFAKLAKLTGEGDTEKLFELISGEGGLQSLKQSGGGSYLDAIFGKEGFGKDPTTLLDPEGEGGNVMKNLMMIQSMIGNKG